MSFGSRLYVSTSHLQKPSLCLAVLLCLLADAPDRAIVVVVDLFGDWNELMGAGDVDLVIAVLGLVLLIFHIWLLRISWLKSAEPPLSGDKRNGRENTFSGVPHCRLAVSRISGVLVSGCVRSWCWWFLACYPAWVWWWSCSFLSWFLWRSFFHQPGKQAARRCFEHPAFPILLSERHIIALTFQWREATVLNERWFTKFSNLHVLLRLGLK